MVGVIGNVEGDAVDADVFIVRVEALLGCFRDRWCILILPEI